jgi:hypothetical protein
MSELIHDKVVKELVQELFEPGKKDPFAESLLSSYLDDIGAQAQLLIKSGYEHEDILKHYQENIMDMGIIRAFIKSSYFKSKLYKESYERLKAFVDEVKSYGDLFTEIYEDETYLNEIFVRLVEETEGVAITSAKQLQELTEITEIYGYWDEEKGETVPYGDKKPTKKEAQEIAYNQIEEAFISAMSYRYSKALEDILEAGGKYKDLLQIKPSFFNLPETWSGCTPSDQYRSILWALKDIFLIGEPNTSVRPDLKTIAQEIEAPYSVLMDAHKISNKWKLQS